MSVKGEGFQNYDWRKGSLVLFISLFILSISVNKFHVFKFPHNPQPDCDCKVSRGDKKNSRVKVLVLSYSRQGSMIFT